MADAPPAASRLLAALPAIYREDPFLAEFLAPFGEILLRGEPGGETGSDQPGFEEAIDRLHEVFDPGRAPERFLPWLAGWVGLELPEGLDVATRRKLIALAVDLRRQRGTAAGLERILGLASGADVTVTEEPYVHDLQIGVHSTIGVDTWLEGRGPGRFHVEVVLPPAGDEGVESEHRARRIEELARQIIERERPAHTRYTLVVSMPEEATDE